jgi:ATP-binding cassette subfamily C (CFTR/MRP) protein 1
MLCLFRILEAHSGKILIDGVDIAEVSLHSLRSSCTIIPQDPFLFEGTIRENVDPTGQYSDENIKNALENSHLEVDLYAKVSHSGENFSVGQRQLIW